MKTILALDGGGMRGLIALGFVERLEALSGGDLPKRFELIGGTSTGAVIATGLALGLPVARIRDFYTDLAPTVFRRSPWRLPGISALFDDALMEYHIGQVCGDRTMESDEVRTGLAVLIKRLDTDEIWIVNNAEGSPYWNDPANGSFIGNRHYRLADIVRAATAAPHYFDPEPLPVAEDDHGVFIDAGVTPFNNPSLALLQLVANPDLGYGWPVGEERLRIVSIGTGTFRNSQPPERLMRMSSGTLALSSLLSSMRHGSQLVLTAMRLLGRTLDDVTRDDLPPGATSPLLPEPLFAFHRFDVRLDADWLDTQLGIEVSDDDVARLRRMDDTTSLDLSTEIGRRAAERLVPDDFFTRHEPPVA